MLNLTPATRVYVAISPIDLRRGANGLFGAVQDQLKLDPLSGHLFVFTNRHHNRLKVLFWDGSGLWVCTKRLQQGRFAWPEGEESACVASLRGEEWVALLSGLEVQARRNWYRR